MLDPRQRIMAEQDVARRSAAERRHAAQQTDADPIHAAASGGQRRRHGLGDNRDEIESVKQHEAFPSPSIVSRPECRAASSRCLRPHELGLDRRRAPQRLQHDAIALGELEQRVELLLGRVGVELERQPDVGEADRRACLSTPSVPRKSRSPSAVTPPERSATPIDGRDRLQRHARRRRPAPRAACRRSRVPAPLPPVAGCSPAAASARPVSTLQAIAASVERARALSVMCAASGSAR